MDPRAARALGIRAIGTGGHRRSICQSSWDVSGDCERPVPVTVAGRPYRGAYRLRGRSYQAVTKGVHVQTADGAAIPYWVDLQVRCGRCIACRRRRRRIWSLRARNECRAAYRTWFCTLTASPQARHLFNVRASRRLRNGGTDFWALSPTEQFSERAKEMGAELTKYVKRVRKKSGAEIRALWVTEEHKDGYPHIHGLIHECREDQPVRWSVLDQWPHGHAVYRLLTDERGAAYVTKYVAKSALCRIRASVKYGEALALKTTVSDRG